MYIYIYIYRRPLRFCRDLRGRWKTSLQDRCDLPTIYP